MAGQTSLNLMTYIVYLLMSIALTVWVARTLHKNGRVFLVDVFHGNEPLADSVNHLLVVGFYLINLGYVSLALRMDHNIPDATASIEALSQKVGTVLIVLGGMHFFNLFIFSRMRRRSTKAANPPVNVAPVWNLPPAGFGGPPAGPSAAGFPGSTNIGPGGLAQPLTPPVTR